MNTRTTSVFVLLAVVLLIPFFPSQAIAGEPRNPRAHRWAGNDQYEALEQRALARPKPREWVSTFRPVALDAPEDAPRLDAGLEIEYAGLQWNKVVVRVLMLVSPQSLQAGSPAAGVDAHEFSVAGQVLRHGEPLESFLYRLRGQPVGQGVPLAFERYLAPGRYTLRVRLEHLASGSVLTDDRPIEVPQLQTVALPRSMSPAPGEASQRLSQLAGVTGGRTFFADDASQLANVYSEIERELRAQYRISYQSSNNKVDGSFRSVQAKLAQGGMEARTISGYYP
ncbi:MAG TPA: hypothetical protein VJ885_00920 [Thermoanaerobaculia bacterium]|nr:hypothetical protein [Thermoanaerobaculia bacterium]